MAHVVLVVEVEASDVEVDAWPTIGGATTGANYFTQNTTTGIVITNLPTKSAVSVSVDVNDVGEHLPLVYVCAHLPEGRLNTTPI
jgi:hypothetical protein